METLVQEFTNGFRDIKILKKRNPSALNWRGQLKTNKMDRLKKPKAFLEKLTLTDSDYQDSGMIDHIAGLLEGYHTEQLRVGGVGGSLLSLAEAECNKRNEHLKNQCNANKDYCKGYEQGWIEATNWFLQKLK